MTKEQLEEIKKIGIPSEELFHEVCNELLSYKQLKEQIGCPLEEIIEFIRLLKKTYYVETTGLLSERWSPFKSNEEELYKINHIFNKIKDKSE